METSAEQEPPPSQEPQQQQPQQPQPIQMTVLPTIRFLSNLKGNFLYFPHEIPLAHQPPCSYPNPRPKCSACQNISVSQCSKTKQPVCSLACYIKIQR